MRKLDVIFKTEAEEILGKFNAEIIESELVDSLWELLPITYRICYWGDSLWQQLPLPTPENAKWETEVEPGDIVYWPPGQQFHIYFGGTPASKSDKPEIYGSVIKVGKIAEDVKDFRDFIAPLDGRTTYIHFRPQA